MLFTWLLISSSFPSVDCADRLGLTGLITGIPFSKNILALPSFTRKLTWNMFSTDFPKQEGSVTNLDYFFYFFFYGIRHKPWFFYSFFYDIEGSDTNQDILQYMEGFDTNQDIL